MMRYEQSYNMSFECNNKISLREASRKENPNCVTKKKCTCKKQCSNLCYCKKNSMKCTSHCHPAKTCTNVESEILTLSDRCCIRDNMELTDQHIDAGQIMLKEQFKLNNGLKDTLTFKYVHGVATPYVQIHHINGNHWIVSAASTPSKKKLGDITAQYLRQYHGIDCRIEMMNVQQQAGTKDCGLFALANATALCVGDDPTSLVYHQAKMRDHFSACLDQKTMTLFPHDVKRCKRMLKHIM